MSTRTLAAVTGTVLALVAAAAPGLGQTRFAVLEEPDGTMVGVAITLSAGSAWELDAELGLTRLAATAIAEEIGPELKSLGGRLDVECGRAATTFGLVLPPTTWEAGATLLLEAMFAGSISDAAVRRARDRVIDELNARDEFTTGIEDALAAAIFGRTSRWARPACGSAETVAALDADDVRRLLRTRFRGTRATAAVAGPVREAVARSVFVDYIRDDALPVVVPAPTSDDRAGQVHVISPTVTTWIGLAFPLRERADTEALRLLGFRIRELFGPSPARPDVYDIRTRVYGHGDGGWLEVILITAPDRARRRGAAVREIVRRTASVALPDDTFGALLTRFRGDRLLELASPEARARAAARQLFFDDGYTAPTARSAKLTADGLRAAAAALGRPAIAVLGPD